MEAYDQVLVQDRLPCCRREDERIGRTGRCRILVQLDSLASTLATSACDDQGIFEASFVKRFAGESDDIGALFMRKMLGLAVRALAEDARYAALR